MGAALSNQTRNRLVATLSGIRVVEFEGWIAGSMLGMLLADQGADVVRIARPGTPVYDNLGAAMLARGKQSLVLDLAETNDRDIALRLASRADIVIENLRPGALDGLGVGEKTLRGLNPRLIHIRLPGFASDDSAHAGLPAYEPIIAASIGMYTELNLISSIFKMDPVYSPLALPSIYGAVQGAIMCNAALLSRERTGLGIGLEVPLAAAAAMAMSSIYMSVEGAPAHYDTPKLPKIVKSIVLPLLRRYWRNSPSRQLRFYNKFKAAVPPMMSAYPCADGRLLYIFAIDHASLSRKVLDVLGLARTAEKFGFVVANPYAGPVKHPNLSATASLSLKAQRWLREQIGSALREKPAFEWEEIFAKAGLPAAVVRTTAEWMEWEPLQMCQAVIASADGQHQPGRQCWFPGEPTQIIGSAPSRNQHAPELRAEAMLIKLEQPDRAVAPQVPWQPLKGIKVLDFSSMVAGPGAARALAELGAEVVKIESPEPRHGPRLTCFYGLDVNQGKQSILIDLKSAGGASAAYELVRTADVVLHNFTPGAAKRLKLDRQSLETLHPDLLVCNIAAYSGPVASDLDERRGYDPVLQMASGISARYGDMSSPELHGIASSIDNLTGYSAAFAIVTALVANAGGQAVRQATTSLVQAANLIQFPYSVDVDAQAPHGQLAMGEDDRTRLWRTYDGWIFSVVKGLSQQAAFDALNLTVDFTIMRSDDLVARMQNAGISAISVERIDRLRQTLARGKHSFRITRRQIESFSVMQLEPDHVRADGACLPPISPAQKPGASTRDVLASAGFSDHIIQEYIASHSVATQLSQDFLP